MRWTVKVYLNVIIKVKIMSEKKKQVIDWIWKDFLNIS